LAKSDMSTSLVLSIGEVAERTGVATSALRFYESVGLIESERSSGNQRRYERSVIRRVAVIKAAQRAGISLDEIGVAIGGLPSGRTPNRRDWEKMSSSWERNLDARIARLTKMRDDLAECIGCGCLSIDRCTLLNPEDQLAATLTGTNKLELASESRATFS
jgi:MerR family transcriptional regulator, redox-sensitive transcriptional activator SoxR